MGDRVHFVNLVSWDYQKPGNNSRYYADSVTFKFAALVFAGKNVRRNSGVRFALDKNLDGCTILGAKKGPNIRALPHFSRLTEIEEFAKEYVLSQDISSNLILGISSPKQDYLARFLQMHGYQGDIFCLGAALEQINRNSLRFDSYGLVWLQMALSNPSRFFSKIALTLRAFVFLMISVKKRNKFRQFISDNFR